MRFLHLILILPGFEAFSPPSPKRVIGGGGLSRLPFGVGDRRPALMVRKMSDATVNYEDVCCEDDPEGTVCDQQDEFAEPRQMRASSSDYRFEFHFRNFANCDIMVNVQHAGCGGTPWHEDRPRCWRSEIPNCPRGLSSGKAVYAPSKFVIHFGMWWDVIKDGITLIYDCAMLFVPGPQTPPHLQHDVPEDPTDGLEDALGIFGDVFALSKDTVSAIKNSQPPLTKEEYEEWLEKGKNAIPEAAKAVGITEAQVYQLADEMNLGTEWAFMSGSTYFKFIRDNNHDSNENHGWSVFKSYGGSKCKHYLRSAKACFVHKGHLIYPVCDGNASDGSKWGWINDKLWFKPGCC